MNENTEAAAPPVTLAEFLRARLAEDEETIRLTTNDGKHNAVGGVIAEVLGDVYSARRMLAEVEAKRRIVELHHDGGEHECWEMHRGVYGPGWPEGSYAVEGQPWAHPSLEGSGVHPGPCETLQLLALPYADHSDYRPEWAP